MPTASSLISANYVLLKFLNDKLLKKDFWPKCVIQLFPHCKETTQQYFCGNIAVPNLFPTITGHAAAEMLPV